MIEKSTFTFLKSLAKNNNREWFKDNKKKYDAAKENVEALIDQMINKIQTFDDRFSKDLSAKDCIFRIYRDIRFSKDKTPYKLNFGANISPGGKKSGIPGYYFHVKPGECFVGGGMYKPDGKQLAAVRQEIDYNTKAFKKILNSASFKKHFGDLKGDKLKTAPKGYPKDHPELSLLQYKGYFTYGLISDADMQTKDCLKLASQKLKAMYALNMFISQAIN